MALDIGILRESFEVIRPVMGQVIDRFYDTAFKRRPMAKEKQELSEALVKVFELLDRPAELGNYLQSLGASQGERGLEEGLFDHAAESWLSTLKFYFDRTWTAELELAWMAVLGLVAENIRTGMIKASPFYVAPVASISELSQSADEVPEPEYAPDVRSAASIQDTVAEAMREEELKLKIESVLREVLKSAILSVAAEPEFKEMAQKKARALIEEALGDELKKIRNQFATLTSSKKVA